MHKALLQDILGLARQQEEALKDGDIETALAVMVRRESLVAASQVLPPTDPGQARDLLDRIAAADDCSRQALQAMRERTQEELARLGRERQRLHAYGGASRQSDARYVDIRR
ncbi:MAG: hypothetical protein AB1445_02640 [Bacillota bacterium]